MCNFYLIMLNTKRKKYNTYISLKSFKLKFLCIYQFLLSYYNTTYPYLNKDILKTNTLMSWKSKIITHKYNRIRSRGQ